MNVPYLMTLLKKLDMNNIHDVHDKSNTQIENGLFRVSKFLH